MKEAQYMSKNMDDTALLYLEGPELDGFERLTGQKRHIYVDWMIEESCWGDECPYKGGKGSASERFLWIQQAFKKEYPLYFPQTWNDFVSCVHSMDQWLLRDEASFGSDCLIVHFYPSDSRVKFKFIAEFGESFRRYVYFFNNELNFSYVRPDLEPDDIIYPSIHLDISEEFKRDLSSVGMDYSTFECDTYHDGGFCFKALDEVADAHCQKMFGPDGVNVFVRAFALLPPREPNIARKLSELRYL